MTGIPNPELFAKKVKNLQKFQQKNSNKKRKFLPSPIKKITLKIDFILFNLFNLFNLFILFKFFENFYRRR